MDGSAFKVPATGRVRMLRAGVTALLLAYTEVPLTADAVWDRAVNLVKAVEHLMPGTIESRTEEYSVNGKLRSTRETLMRAQVIDGELTYEVLRHTRNGQVVEPDQADSITGASSMNFSRWTQVDLSRITGAQRNGDQRKIDGQTAIGYSIEAPTDTYTIRGQGWLSEDGLPLELQYTADPLPRTVKSLAISTTYGQLDNVALVTKITVHVAIGISIFYRRLYAITVALADYFDPDG